MKISVLTVLVSFLALSCFASEKKHKHREHTAHSHGTGTLAIALDETKGKIEFRAAAEGILGFENRPKSTKDEKIVADTIVRFEKEINQMVQFESSMGCLLTQELIGQVPEKGDKPSTKHSDWVANYSVQCQKNPLGSKIVIDFSQFKRLKDIDITVLVGSLQKSAEYKKKPVTIELK